VLTEELLDAGQQVLIIDPTDVWWGLKSSADGEHAGYPVVVLGGKHADLPLTAGDGATIADFVCDNPVSVVCSLRRFASKADMRRFVTDLATRLYARRGDVDDPQPLMIIIDEAALFVPQRVMGEEAAMVGAIQQLVRQGRSSGFGVTLIDQRAASVNKDVLTQLELLVAHRTTSPQDRKAMREWAEAHDTEDKLEAFMGGLASLPRGTAWVWSPGWLSLFKRADMRARRTFDSSRTPKAGERLAAPQRMAAIDLDALKGKLATTIERARADDPKALRAEIAKLQGELRRVGAEAKADPAALDQAYRRGEIAGQQRFIAVLREGTTLLGSLTQSIDNFGQQLAEHAARVGQLGQGLSQHATPALTGLRNLLAHAMPANGESAIATAERVTAPSSAPAFSPRTHVASAPRVAPPRSTPGGRSVAERILDTIGALEKMGVRQPDKATVAALVGYHPNAKSFANAIGGLRTAGHIDYPTAGRIALTREGRELAQASLPIGSLDELHALWFDRLGNVAERILRPLIAAYPQSVRVEDVAAAADYHPNAKSFANAKGRLRTLGLIAYPGHGLMVATDVLFPEGLR
jgi:hypothetical protein